MVGNVGANPAPPHARGWTDTEFAADEVDVGSPARAGMDPHRGVPRGGPEGLPRTRGDGPVLQRPHRPYDTAPPHARGWTPCYILLRADSCGSPARAGMDPPRRPRRSPWPRLPRTRGDGPSQLVRAADDVVAPPHARGWTRPDGRRVAERVGSPARAGMDPCGRARPASRRRLPRTRGDGPEAEYFEEQAKMAPPHARGWTHGAGRGAGRGDGSPARAGMDRQGPPLLSATRWLPRTRGDGPVAIASWIAVCRAPPHARGWTVCRVCRAFQGHGSPARAGMDPSSPGGTSPGAWLPRTRGDGPAGALRQGAGRTAPPHARGWTVSPVAATACAPGSPARAGMDPFRTSIVPSAGWLPRTRGDGPGGATIRGQPSRAPPHARGWTQHSRIYGDVERGSPARAGMDRS